MTRDPCRRGHVWTAEPSGRRCDRCHTTRIDCLNDWHVWDHRTCIKCGKTEGES